MPSGSRGMYIHLVNDFVKVGDGCSRGNRIDEGHSNNDELMTRAFN